MPAVVWEDDASLAGSQTQTSVSTEGKSGCGEGPRRGRVLEQLFPGVVASRGARSLRDSEGSCPRPRPPGLCRRNGWSRELPSRTRSNAARSRPFRDLWGKRAPQSHRRPQLEDTGLGGPSGSDVFVWPSRLSPRGGDGSVVFQCLSLWGARAGVGQDQYRDTWAGSHASGACGAGSGRCCPLAGLQAVLDTSGPAPILPGSKMRILTSSSSSGSS